MTGREPADALRAWLTDGRGLDWPRLLLVALALATLLALGIAASTSGAAFGPYNPGWDGASEFHASVADDPSVESEVVRDPARYDAVDPEGTVAVVVAPDEPYDDEAAARVAAFVADGGTLVVLEDVGAPGNALLADVGADARLDGRLLRDEESHVRGPLLPVATGVEPHPLTADVDRLTLNYATAVEPGDAEVLVATSEYAYLVDDPDETLDEGEHTLAAHPVATAEPVGDGTVIVVGDPSVATNAMREEPDNAAFVDALARQGDRVLLDVSHADGLPPAAAATLTLRESPALQALLGAAGIGAVALLASGRPGPALARLARRLAGRDARAVARDLERRGAGLTDAERAELLRRRHPDWDDERIERVIAALNRSGSKHEADR